MGNQTKQATTTTTHPPVSLSNANSAFTFNPLTQTGNIPSSPSFSSLNNALTLTAGNGVAPFTYTPTIYDFWLTNGGQLPDGATDNTDSITRTGFVGLNVQAVSRFDNGGSVGNAVSAVSAAAFNASDEYVIDLTAVVLQTVTLPLATSAPRRTYVIRNATSTVKAVTSYLSLTGLASTIIPANTTLCLQSNGANWLLIYSNYTGTQNLPQIVAKATVAINDPVPLGARVVTNAFNVASATGLDGSLAQARLSVVFATPVASADYIITGNVTSQAPGAWVNNSSTFWTVVSKTTTGFTITFREVVATTQAVNFDFMVQQQQAVGLGAPAFSSTYVGITTGTNAIVRLDNFLVRYNNTTNNLEIATVTGSETIFSYDETVFGAGSFINIVDATKVVTTAFSTWGDPGLTVNGEHRTYLFTPQTTGDSRAYVLELAWWNSPTAKIMMALRRWA